MKQVKTCSTAHFVILLTVLLTGCGNKGPLVRPVSAPETTATVETTDVETEQKETKK